MADERPLGVSILAVLGFVSGALAILNGIGALIYGGMIGAMSAQYGYSPMGGAVAGSGVLGIITGLVSIAISYGLWTGKSWAWWITLIFSALGAITILLLNPLALISAVIVWYLLKPHVQSYFGVDFQYKT